MLGKYAWWVLVGATCSACALHATKQPTPVLPQAFEHTTTAQSANWPSQDWYRDFGSDELNALIEQAAAGNFDLATASSRVRQADMRAQQAHAAILPSVDANTNGNYLAGHSTNGSAHETDWAALLSASYEIDFWGKNRASAESARYLAAAARADRDTVALTTLAAVADGYFQVVSLRERLALAHDNVAAARSLMDIVQARYEAGVSNPVEVATQRSTFAAAQLTIPELEQTEAEALAALALLEGRPPEKFQIAAKSLESLKEPAVAPGLPSELLQRRPDIINAEANLRSASADVLVARAALFPSINLTAAGGVQNPALNAAVTTLAGVGPTLSLAGALSQPIFDAGKLRAARAEAQAKEQELATGYRAAIVSALVDVENALAAMQHLDAARDFQLENVVQAQRAFDGASLRYKAGYGDFLAALEAQRLLYTARDLYSQYRLGRLRALVSLSKALGGGWQGSVDLPDSAEQSTVAAR